LYFVLTIKHFVVSVWVRESGAEFPADPTADRVLRPRNSPAGRLGQSDPSRWFTVYFRRWVGTFWGAEGRFFPRREMPTGSATARPAAASSRWRLQHPRKVPYAEAFGSRIGPASV